MTQAGIQLRRPSRCQLGNAVAEDSNSSSEKG
jgi:hypothetical protein